MLLIRFLHLLSVLGFVSGQVLGDFVSRGLRHAGDGKARAALLELMSRAAWSLGLGCLVLLGVFGNLLAVQRGYRMAESHWLQTVNGLFLLMLIAWLVGVLPALRKLRQAAETQGGAPAPDFDRLRRRWFAWHSVLDALYLLALVLMVWRFS
jgi:uncharacterized membrane protein